MELSHRLGVHNAWTSRATGALEREGLVVRSIRFGPPGDRRARPGAVSPGDIVANPDLTTLSTLESIPRRSSNGWRSNALNRSLAPIRNHALERHTPLSAFMQSNPHDKETLLQVLLTVH